MRKEEVLGILYKQTLKLKTTLIKSRAYKSLEVADNTMNYSILVIYGPPLPANGMSMDFFLGEYSNSWNKSPLILNPSSFLVISPMNGLRDSFLICWNEISLRLQDGFLKAILQFTAK